VSWTVRRNGDVDPAGSRSAIKGSSRPPSAGGVAELDNVRIGYEWVGIDLRRFWIYDRDLVAVDLAVDPSIADLRAKGMKGILRIVRADTGW
jgi:hypothetical protein